MAAGLGFKTFTTGEVLTAADTNGYLMQGVLVFASSAARAAAITSPQEGQYSFLKDTDALEYYNGSAWVGAPVGDITAVTAGKGLSGGGSSGDVTVSLGTTAKGDLVAGSGTTTAAVLPVGTNGQTLVADSTASTGLKWATPSSGSSFSGCRLLKPSGNQAIADSTYVAVTWPTEDIDVNGYHSTVTNTSRITIPASYGGYYRFSWQQYVVSSAAVLLLYKNGARYTYESVPSGTPYCFTTIAAGAVGDYFEVYLRQTSGSSQTIGDENNGAQGIVWFDCHYLGA